MSSAKSHPVNREYAQRKKELLVVVYHMKILFQIHAGVW